jgi:hypothetical protein
MVVAQAASEAFLALAVERVLIDHTFARVMTGILGTDAFWCRPASISVAAQFKIFVTTA